MNQEQSRPHATHIRFSSIIACFLVFGCAYVRGTISARKSCIADWPWRLALEFRSVVARNVGKWEKQMGGDAYIKI